MADRVKETAKDEALRVRQLAEDGVKSGAYIYPLKVSKSKVSNDTASRITNSQ